VVAAGDEIHAAHLGALEVVGHGREIAEGVVGAVIEQHLAGMEPLAAELPGGVFGIAAAAHQ
jgi:hypothetical protein